MVTAAGPAALQGFTHRLWLLRKRSNPCHFSFPNSGLETSVFRGTLLPSVRLNGNGVPQKRAFPNRSLGTRMKVRSQVRLGNEETGSNHEWLAWCSSRTDCLSSCRHRAWICQVLTFLRMVLLFSFLSLAYFLACFGLACYSFLGLCIRPLAATESFAAGKLLLIVIFLFCAVLVGGLYGTLTFSIVCSEGWRELFASDGAQITASLLVSATLPFCLCWHAVRRYLVAVFGIACISLFAYGRAFLLVSAGA